MESKISPYPTWTRSIASASLHGVRTLLVLVALTRVVHAGAPSNPAFLGIGLEDARLTMPIDGCRVISVTPGSGADSAGLGINDVVQALDGVVTASCPQLSAAIILHSPGDIVSLDLVRGAQRLTKKATLITRAELLHRR